MEVSKLREKGRINVNKAIACGAMTKDALEPEGSREKFWTNDNCFLVKQIKEGTLEDYGEIIGMEIAHFLGINTAYYDFAIYNNKKSVISVNFLEKDERLISGVEIIDDIEEYIMQIQGYCKSYYNILKQYNISSIKRLDEISTAKIKDALYEILMIFKISGIKSKKSRLNNVKLNDVIHMAPNTVLYYLREYNEIFEDMANMYQENFTLWNNNTHECNNLFDIQAILDIYLRKNGLHEKAGTNIMKELSDRLIFDLVTLQGDRHASNWSIILDKSKNEVRLAPIYDSANCFCLAEEKIFYEINNTIVKLNNKALVDKKKQKMKLQLTQLINKPRTKFRFFREDVINKTNNYDMLQEIKDYTAPECYEEIINNISQLTPENVEKIFTKIEERGITIPVEIKNVVKATINIEVNNINEIFRSKEVKL